MIGIFNEIPCNCQNLAILSRKLSFTLVHASNSFNLCILGTNLNLSTSTAKGGCQSGGGLILHIPAASPALLILLIYLKHKKNENYQNFSFSKMSFKKIFSTEYSLQRISKFFFSRFKYWTFWRRSKIKLLGSF